MTKLCFILGDQLTETISSLNAINQKNDIVFLCEVRDEATYVRHHPKKIALIFSAMRHFARYLKEKRYKVRYTMYDAPENCGSFANELIRVIDEEKISEIHITYPGEWRVLKIIEDLQKQILVPIIFHEDTRFFCKISEFREWAKGKKQLRMEYFYRLMRKKHNILLDETGNPIGGEWNYDKENRKNANSVEKFPIRINHFQDTITLSVIDLVEKEFSENFGKLKPFNFAVTRESALAEASYFMENCLQYFGEYQDAMRTQEVNLYHSKLSFYLNIGLLLPLELCHMAESAFKKFLAPLNSVEGFIRQILGWREYIRGVYWLMMPEYAERNFFNASRPLPALYWGKPTHMFCLQEVVKQTELEAYSHHIQRLMITGNFALLAGINPQDVCDWYLAVYADAFEWVELPNTLGMALYADGGLLASKPYAASGKYINRMSDFCKNCIYDPGNTVEENACPFNSLYWNFIIQNQEKLRKNLRMKYVYANLDKMDNDKKSLIQFKAKQFLDDL